MRYNERAFDLRGAALAQDEAGRATAAKLREQAKQECDAAQLALLGPDKYHHMEEYVRTLPLRNVVLGVAGPAALEGVPLTMEQSEGLVQAALGGIADARTLGGVQLAQQVDWAALDRAAQTFLTPEQFRLFKTVAPMSGFESRWTQQVNAEIRRATGGEPSRP